MAILNRKTLVLVGCAIALGGAVLLIESRSDKAVDAVSQSDSELVSDTDEVSGELMFAFAEEDIERFTLSRPGETLAFVRDDNDFWRMTSPQEAEAEGGAIAFLLSQLTSTALRTIEVAPDTLEKFGLVEPDTTIELVAAGEAYQFSVGSTDFTGDQRYAIAIAVEEAAAQLPDEKVTIHLVSGGITNAVDRPTAEWLVEVGDAASEPADPERALEPEPEAVAPEETAPKEAAPDEEKPEEKKPEAVKPKEPADSDAIATPNSESDSED